MTELNQKDENLKNDEALKGNSENATSLPQPKDVIENRDKEEITNLQNQIVEMQKKFAGNEDVLNLVKNLELQCKKLTEKAQEEERQKEEKCRSEIDTLSQQFKPFDSKAYSNLKKEEKEQHILKKAILFDFPIDKLTLKQKKSAIEYVISQQNKHRDASKSTNSPLGQVVIQSKLEEGNNFNNF